MDHLGHDGNGACLNHMMPTWGVNSGSLTNFTKCCFRALNTTLKDSIKWPNAMEHHQIHMEFSKLGFPNCVGLIDGTLLLLSQRPKVSGECYYDRKSRYSVNAKVVYDRRRKILYLYTSMQLHISIAISFAFLCSIFLCNFDNAHIPCIICL